MSETQANRVETGRNPDGTFKPGVSGNPDGRPKNTLKAFLATKFRNMSDEEKEEWLKKNRIDPELIWKMAEGNPSNATELTGKDGEPLFNNEHKSQGISAVRKILGGNTRNG